MPIYEFKCQSCGHRFEKLCNLGDSGENLDCPRCETTGPRRVMSGFAAKTSGKGGDGPSGGMSGGSGCGGCTSASCGSCGH